MPNFLRRFDGSGRVPFKSQIEFLTWLAEGWDQSKIHVSTEPVGSGKSGSARAIQMETGAHVITPSNYLVDQYHGDYPNVNVLKGKEHYRCSFSGLTCADWQNTMEQEPCGNCPYTEARDRACGGEDTFFNPISMYYATRNKNWTPPKVIVVDEAHQLASMISMLCGTRLRKSMYQFDDRCNNEIYCVQWLKLQEGRLAKLAELYGRNQDFKRLAEISRELEGVRMTRRGLESDAQNYAIWIDEGTYHRKKELYLNIKPIQPPRFVVERLLASSKLVMMSGTIFKPDVEELVGDMPFRYRDAPSPIPKAQRPVFYRPAPFKMNFETDPRKIVQAIEDVIKRNPGLNTIVHVTYSMSRKLAPLFTIPIIFNTEQDKSAKIEEFKKNGGVFLAAGCAEGIDLKGDMCRLNIIPKLAFPDLSDHIVKKRKALPDGEEWYLLQTFKVLLQQVGRSTRGVNDWSKTYILDPGFGYRFKQISHKLPGYFNESLVWSREP